MAKTQATTDTMANDSSNPAVVALGRLGDCGTTNLEKEAFRK